MSGCVGSLLTDIEVAVGDTTKKHPIFRLSRSDECTHQKYTGGVNMSDRKHVLHLTCWTKCLQSSLLAVLGTCFVIGFCRGELLCRMLLMP